MDLESLTPGGGGPGLPTWTLLRQSIGLWVGAVLLIPGAVFSVIGVQQVRADRAYATQGVVVDATVLHKSIVPADRAGNSRSRYVVTYSFTSAPGRQTRASSDVAVEQWESLTAGSPLTVTYVPDAPLAPRPTDGTEAVAAVVFAAIGGVFVIVGGGLTFRGVRGIRRALRISRLGHATEGTVLSVEPTSTSINRVRQWRIHYEFRDYVGQTRQSASHLLSPADASGWQTGDHGLVRVDRERPELSVWMGRATCN